MWDCDVDSFGLMWDCDVELFGLMWDCDVDLFDLRECDVDLFGLWDCDVDSLGPMWECDLAQLVETLRYKPEGRGFDPRWCDWNFHWHSTSRPSNSASNRNECQGCLLGGKGCRCVGLTTLPPSCADCLVIWEPEASGTLRACPGL